VHAADILFIYFYFYFSFDSHACALIGVISVGSSCLVVLVTKVLPRKCVPRFMVYVCMCTCVCVCVVCMF